MCSKKFIIYLLIISLVLSVSIVDPARSRAAAAPLIGTLGSKAAVAKFIEFVTVMAAGGVMIDNFEEIINLYNQPDAPDPERPPEFDPEMSKLANIILGSATANYIYQNLGNFRTWLIGIFGTLQPGDNIQTNDWIIINNYPFKLSIRDSDIKKAIFLEYYLNNEIVKVNIWDNGKDLRNLQINSNSFYGGSYRANVTFEYYYDQWKTLTTNIAFNVDSQIQTINDVVISPDNSISISANAPLIAVEFDPAPPLGPLVMPSIKTVNPDSENIQLMPMPDGTVKEVYTGDLQQYEDELLEHITFEDLQTITQPGSSPVEQIKINNEDYIVLDPVVGESPYPDINQDPIADPSEFQGKNISLLMGITNWLKLIWESIMSIPQWLSDLFVLPEDYWGNNFNTIQTKLSTKFDQEGSINFIDSLKSISPKPIPDLYYKDEIILSAGFVNNMAHTIKSWLRFFLWVAMVLFGMNSAYKLIRGGNAIERGWYNDSKGSN